MNPNKLPQTGTVSQINASPSAPRQESELEASCRQWTYMIPRSDPSSFRHKPVVDLKKFFETGWGLVERGDAGTRQYIITKLATENGLSMVKALADLMTDSMPENIAVSIFQNRTFPFFQIISHSEIISSLVLESALDCIYNFLFGPSGRRAVQVFRSTCTAIVSLITQQSSLESDLQTKAISSSVAVLQRLIDGCQTAQVIKDFILLVDTISACMPDDTALLPAQESLLKIRRRLGIGESLPVKIRSQTAIGVHDVTFELDVDLPGRLSKHGRRHDNDCENISEIRILPTAAEILSHRDEYLPSSKSSTQHLSGIAGLLDKHFRLLREDTVGQVRDAVGVELSRLEHPDRTGQMKQGKKIVRNIVHRNLRLLSLTVEKKKGLQVLVGFDQPEQIRNKSRKQREEWWQNTKRLQLDSFVCVVCASRRTIFFSVCEAPTTPNRNDRRASENPSQSGAARDVLNQTMIVPSLFQDDDQATVLLSMVEHNEEDVEWIINHIGARHKSRQSLVEFPGILLPSFQATLQALQRMSRTLDVPFSNIIARDSHGADIDAYELQTKPPAYACQPGFRFNLDCLTAGNLSPLDPRSTESFDFETFQEHTTLDEAQQRAVVHALKSPLAAIQGPPGTGKSYTGVSILKALLNNRGAAKLGPIICVCYTNHALDQLLEHLWKDGVRQIIRLGSRSKSEILQKLNLHVVSKNVEPTKQEKHDKWQYNQQISTLVQELQSTLAALNNPTSWTNVRDYLQLHNTRHFNDLFKGSVDEDGFTEVKEGKKIRVVEGWLKNAPKRLTSNRPAAELQLLPLRDMSSLERTALHKYWLKEQSNELVRRLLGALDELYDAKSKLDKCHQELDLRCLRQANIIGVTTSGLAKTIDVLGRVGAKVVLCEEAGEVLEAHTLTTFLPGLQHAILIGDHEQLRPQINNNKLKHENPRGQKFSLDISLFERLVNPQPGHPKLPCVALETQRRMHPSIAELVRVPLYPNLKDHPSVSKYPEVEGMRKRLFWLDHCEKEDPRPAQSLSTTFTNSFEVDMVEALVAHLVRQGTYGNEDIAVLTPYLGQLQKIRKRLASTFAIVVGDRDIEELEARGIEDTTNEDERKQTQKSTLLSALRIATVDNFQGEEAKVIVISLVRGNDERECGFLKTSNRINVLLSRARHGMYLIGNSETASPVPMWSQVIDILQSYLSMMIMLVPLLAVPCYLVDIFAVLDVENATSEKMVSSSIEYISHARLRVEDHIQPAHTVAKLHAMTGAHAHSAPSLARLAALIQNAANDAVNLAYLVLKIAPGHVNIMENAMVVDYIMSSTYEEIDLDENPCIIPSCGHILTLESMDGHMSMADFYISNEAGEIVGLSKSSVPFSASALKNCPQCRGPLRNINRYSRIVRRALIDESTKKFIVWANVGFIPLVKRMKDIEGELRDSTQVLAATTINMSQTIELKGGRDGQFNKTGLLVRDVKQYRSVLRLRREIKQFLKQVDETEQPFGRVRDLVLDARRHLGVKVDDSVELSAADILQTRSRLLTTVLLIRCDYTILASFLESYKKVTAKIATSTRPIKIDFIENRKDCESLIEESIARSQPAVTVEGHIYWACFAALERAMTESSDRITALRDTAREHLQQAKLVCTAHAGQTQGMMNEIMEVENMLRDSTFYLPVTNEEKAAVYAAMARSFTGTGHWYYCKNGHPFTVGECGMPMQTSRCPQCGETVGGTDHTAVEGVRRAEDLEREFGNLRVG
ncbi:hypothetical protein EG329_012647 [Mollisiaceae sp. DMI_Dod_QoI]|nr:hypothetical protein EG329_012647 [Helotiales sp. DMI_Dod_QoI]